MSVISDNTNTFKSVKKVSFVIAHQESGLNEDTLPQITTG